MKSEVEIYWEQVAKHFGIEVEFKELHPMLQMQVIESINLLLGVLNQIKK